MFKFEDAKLGNRVWDITLGQYGKIIEIHKENDVDYPLIVEYMDDEKMYRRCYTLDGRIRLSDLFPVLYWNKIKLPNVLEDKKTFDLMEYLKENIKPKRFNGTDKNWCFYYDTILKHFESGAHSIFQTVETVYFTEEDIKKVIPKLEEEKITSEQLTQAFKELGWL